MRFHISSYQLLFSCEKNFTLSQTRLPPPKREIIYGRSLNPFTKSNIIYPWHVQKINMKSVAAIYKNFMSLRISIRIKIQRRYVSSKDYTKQFLFSVRHHVSHINAIWFSEFWYELWIFLMRFFKAFETKSKCLPFQNILTYS